MMSGDRTEIMKIVSDPYENKSKSGWLVDVETYCYGETKIETFFAVHLKGIGGIDQIKVGMSYDLSGRTWI